MEISLSEINDGNHPALIDHHFYFVTVGPGKEILAIAQRAAFGIDTRRARTTSRKAHRYVHQAASTGVFDLQDGFNFYGIAAAIAAARFIDVLNTRLMATNGTTAIGLLTLSASEYG
jgi:hypothetical protein